MRPPDLRLPTSRSVYALRLGRVKPSAVLWLSGSYWLSGEIDPERGWGIKDDSFTVFERLRRLGAPDWFGLSDRDLATCLRRRALLEQGRRLTEAQLSIGAGLGIEAAVLPMCDQPVRTRVLTPAGWRGFQECLVRERAEPEIERVEFAGVGEATPTPEIAAAVAGAGAIVIGPSNPVISIGPILAVPGMRELLAPADAAAAHPDPRGRGVDVAPAQRDQLPLPKAAHRRRQIEGGRSTEPRRSLGTVPSRRSSSASSRKRTSGSESAARGLSTCRTGFAATSPRRSANAKIECGRDVPGRTGAPARR